MMKNSYRFAATFLLSLGLTSMGFAHHSFQVYYDNSKIIKVEGVVESFRFTNPHAIVKLKAVDANGAEQIWTVETTAFNLTMA